MPRRRLAAVLLVPSPWAAEIDGLRRACGDSMLDRVPPHITLVSPVNVPESDIGAALAALRRGAAAVRGPVEVEIGPAATFARPSPVLYLPVEVAPGLVAIQAAVRHGPLARPPKWEWVPHVTIGQDLADRRLEAGVEALADYRISTSFDRLHLMEERTDDHGWRAWVPIADVMVGPTAVVGRGTFPIELTIGAIIDPEVLALADRMGVLVPPTGPSPVVVTARRVDSGELAGAALSVPPPTEATWEILAPGAAEEGVGEHMAARMRWVTESQ